MDWHLLLFAHLAGAGATVAPVSRFILTGLKAFLP
jgi:hypothetical protein